jgi:hypothetical protein
MAELILDSRARRVDLAPFAPGHLRVEPIAGQLPTV